MLNRLRKKKSVSIQSYLIGVLIFTIVIQGVVILTTLISRDFYEHVDEQIMEIFITRSDQQIDDVNAIMNNNVKQVITASQEITNIYTTASGRADQTISEVDLSNENFNDSHVSSSKILLDLLDKCVIDSAFLLLNDEDNQDVVYVELVNTYPELQGDGYQAYQILTGSTLISKTYELGIHKKWELGIEEAALEKETFIMPKSATELEPYGSLEQYGYWNYSTEGSRNGETTYSLPLINELGECYGVVGIGITEDYFYNHYVNEEHYSYENNFYAVAMNLDGVYVVSENTVNTEHAKEKLDNNFTVKDLYVEDNVYQVEFKESGKNIVKIDRLNMYSGNSPFIDQELVYLTIISKDELTKNSNDIKNIFAISFAIAALIGVILSLLIAKFSTIKINGLSKSIHGMSANEDIEFQSTGFTEIDDLTDAIKVLNDKVLKSNQTLNHLFELTELNLGGFESVENGDIRITEYIMRLLDIKDENIISINEWNQYYKQLTKTLIDKDKRIYLYSNKEHSSYIKVTQTSDDSGCIGMVLDVTKEIEDMLAAKHKVDYDALTGLFSRTAFYQKAQELIDNDPYKTGCVVFIDLDNLKFVNDSFGHDYGDMYLIEGSKIFTRIAKGNGIAARMSGDEFAIYLHGYYSKDEIRQLLYMHLEESVHVTIDLPDGTIQRVRFSAGISWYGEDSKDINELVKYADFAMYDAKHSTKGTHREFNLDVYNEKIYMMENTEAINKLIEEKSVRFMFQPIVCLKTGKIYAYEALMRSDLDEFKSPAEILQLASGQFKLKELEEMLVLKAMETAYNNREKLDGAKVFINSIASQMMSSKSLDAVKAKYGDFLNQIVIEITEAEDNTPEKMKLKVDTIKQYGMMVALDDFGSGYSNELRIISMGPDVVKLDMELIQGISTDTDKQVLCKNIISYCHTRNIKTVCEGVEVREDLEMITKLGADLVQGYYVQKPAYEILPISKEMENELKTI